MLKSMKVTGVNSTKKILGGGCQSKVLMEEGVPGVHSTKKILGG